MRTRKMLALTAIFALLLPLIGAFGPGAKTALAATPQGQLLENYFVNVGGTEHTTYASQYTYSLNGIIQQSSSPPSNADWAVVSQYHSDRSGGVDSSQEEFAYSNFGVINYTNDPTDIPATASWATLSSMQIAASTGTSNPKFEYSMSGSDFRLASDIADIPATALWVTLSEFEEESGMGIHNTGATLYTLNRDYPSVQWLELSSSNGYPGVAKNGDTVTLQLQTDIPIAKPKMQIGGIEADVSGSGKSWTGEIEITNALAQGWLSVAAEFYSVNGAPGPKTERTTDESEIFKDSEPPQLEVLPDTDRPYRDDLTVFVSVQDSGPGVEEVKWASGTLTSADFASGGEAIPLDDLAFSVEQNGTYSVYARDFAGNEIVVPVVISNIDKIAPTIKLTPSTAAPTAGPITVKVEAEDAESGMDEIRWSAREPEPDSPWPAQNVQGGQFTAAANGTYTVIAWDQAGNRTIEKIVISNISSPDADLNKLSVANGTQPLTLTPSFDPARTDYQVNVPNEVSSIQIAAEAGKQASTVSVNGRNVTPGGSADINLSVGANTVTVLVTAPLTSVTKTYTLVVTRAAGASSGGGIVPSGSSSSASIDPPAKMPGAFRAELSGQALTGKALEELVTAAKTASNGSVEYELQLNGASEILAQAPKNKPNELSLKRDPAARIDTLTLRISEQAQAQLREGQISLNLDLGGVRYKLPAGFSTDGGGGLLAKLTLLPSQGNEAMLQAVSSVLNPGAKPRLSGAIVQFSTNERSAAGTEAFVLPLPDGFDQTQAKNLAVFAEDAGGKGSVLRGTVQRDAQGRATGLAVNLDGSGRIVLLQAEPTITEQAGYVQGVSSDSFAPNRAVTRAELAALLNQLSEPSTATPTAIGASFRDLPQSSWAASAVARVTEAGWMSGGADDRFRPTDALTRGELAVVLARWKQIQAGGNAPSFTDSIPAWAAEAVASAEREGWIKGYADGSFRAGQSVTRAEAITILNRATGRPSLEDDRIALWPDVPNAYWAAGAIRSASRTIEVRTYANGEIETSAK